MDLAGLLDLINCFRKSQVLFSLVQLGIPEILRNGDLNAVDVAASGTLATAAAVLPSVSPGQPPSAEGVARLLNAAVALKLLSKSGSTGAYGLTPVAREYLCNDSPTCLCGYVVHSSKLLYQLWSNLPASVLSGRNVWPLLPEFTEGDMFDKIYSTDADLQRFASGMHAFSSLSAPALVRAFDLSRFTTMLDLGGSTGALAAHAVREYPRMKAIVVDLPRVVAAVQPLYSQAPYIPDADCRARVTWLAADFFTDALPPADLVVLSRILHDWDEANVRSLLQRVANHLPVGGCLLLCEMLVGEDGVSPAGALLQDLNMLVQTEGRERTLGQYAALLQAAGFGKVQGRVTGTYLDAVVAEKL